MGKKGETPDANSGNNKKDLIGDMDANNDNDVSEAELTTALTDLNKVNAIKFADLPKDDKKVTLEKFKEYANTHRDEINIVWSVYKPDANVFALADKNGDGQLDETEFGIITKAAALEGPTDVTFAAARGTDTSAKVDIRMFTKYFKTKDNVVKLLNVQLDKAKLVFDKIDNDGSGGITKAELDDTFNQLLEEDKRVKFSEFSKGDGESANFREFVAYFVKSSTNFGNLVFYEKAVWSLELFEAADTDNGGTISKEEFTQFGTTIGATGEFTDAEFTLIPKTDSKVSRLGWIKHFTTETKLDAPLKMFRIHNIFKRLDGDGDKSITEDELNNYLETVGIPKDEMKFADVKNADNKIDEAKLRVYFSSTHPLLNRLNVKPVSNDAGAPGNSSGKKKGCCGSSFLEEANTEVVSALEGLDHPAITGKSSGASTAASNMIEYHLENDNTKFTTTITDGTDNTATQIVNISLITVGVVAMITASIFVCARRGRGIKKTKVVVEEPKDDEASEAMI